MTLVEPSWDQARSAAANLGAHLGSVQLPIKDATDRIIAIGASTGGTEAIKDVQFATIVLDEAQAIKNSETAQTRAVKSLKSERRLVMTGTPIENHVGELWSLFDFCSPGLLGGVTEFRRYLKRLSEQGDGQAYAGLRRLVQPYILRRQKTDPEISRDLPEKIEMRAECGLTAQQASLYAGVVQDLKRQLKQVDGIQRRGLVLSTLLRFKQICNHPAQFLEFGRAHV